MSPAEPRIAPLREDELGSEGLAVATKLRAAYGLTTKELPETIATMLRHPVLYNAYVDYVNVRTKSSVLEPRDMEIVILRTCWLCQCGYVWGEHVKFGKNAGLTADDIDGLIEGSGAPGWSERDGALLRIAEELHDTSFVSDETWAVLAAHFTDQQLIELLIMVGAYHEVAFLYNAMRVRPLPGSAGLAAR